LASLENQTFKDFEVILWDNGSTDATVEEAHKWIPSRLPGQVVSDSPLPLHECLAKMVTQAKSEFVARMDADDICLPERLALQIEQLGQDERLAAIGGQMELIDASGLTIGPAEWSPIDYSEILFSFLFGNPMAHPTVTFRRQAILDVGNYAMAKPVEDYDLWMRVAARFRLANMAETLLKYRRHSGAVCGSGQMPNTEIYEAMSVAVQANCMALFELDAETYVALRAKRHPVAIWALLPVYFRCSRKAGVPVVNLLKSSSAVNAARCLTGKHDYVSKLIWRFLEWI